MRITLHKIGIISIALSLSTLAGCGGGSGTDNKKAELVTCSDPLVLLDNGQCGAPRDKFVPPACPDEQIRSGDGNCVAPDFPAPVYYPKAGEAVIYVNIDNDNKESIFNTYNLHLWQDCGNGWGSTVTDGKGGTWSIPTTWPAGPLIKSSPTSSEYPHDPYYGAYFVIPVNSEGSCGNFIVKKNRDEAQTNDLSMNIKFGGEFDRMAWVIVNENDMRSSRVSNLPICINDICTLTKPLLSFTDVEAHWISPRTIVWDREFAADKKVELYSSLTGGMSASDDGKLVGGNLIATLSTARALTPAEIELVPHLENYVAYDLPETVSLDAIKEAVTHETLIVGRIDAQDDDGNTIERGQGTRIQLPHVLDALYTHGENDADEATLGVSYGSNGVTASVWAPTAQLVELRIYSNDLRLADSKPMVRDAATGIWRITGSLAELDRKFYRYRVTAYSPLTKAVQRREATDPYSISLGVNGAYSQFVNIADADLKPSGWDGHESPAATAPEQIAIYEVHVRDFSINDASTSAANRGKYLGFTETNSVPVNHLRSLKNAGLTHVHFLPINDSSNMNETFTQQVNLDSYVFDLCQRSSNADNISVCQSGNKAATLRSLFESYDATSSQARELVDAMKDLDGFNWGYDPQHFNAPDGSYASDAKGAARIKEMRAMIKSLHDLGLRVVLDVVYPHTVSSGLDVANSVFDKVVPGYYYRANKSTADVETGTGAGPDTATEHRMMSKFVKDSVVQWAANYRVDGFRFDQSGFMPKSTLVEAHDAVKAFDPTTYFYAEAWNPHGGTSEQRIKKLSTQVNLAGTGMGTFNDRIRDPLQKLALIKGENVDAIRLGLAGNLANYPLVAKSGAIVKGSVLGAYNLDPQEAVNYVEKHDNETLWDWMHRPNTLANDVTVQERVRIHSLTQAIPVLSQGVAFIHMGADFLRSKSMSPNSYNAGDWFNKVDFTLQDNNWAKGLPPELRDGVTDEHVITQFNNPETYANAQDMAKASAVFNEFLRIRSTSPLFNLPTEADVINRVGFHNTGKAQIAGVIVMSIDDGAGKDLVDLDPSVDAAVVVINGTESSKTLSIPTAKGFSLHAVQQQGADETVKSAQFTFNADANKGSFTVPAYTLAVFVQPQEGAQGEGLAADVSLPKEIPPPFGDAPVYVPGDVTAGGWDAQAENEMRYVGEGIYILEAQLGLMSEAQFKFAAADWSFPNYGAKDAFVLNEWIAVAQGSDDNLKLTITEAGLYRFELDASDVNAPKVRVSNPDVYRALPVKLVGEFTDWNFDHVNSVAFLHTSNSFYNATVSMTANSSTQFKIANPGWSDLILGVADTSPIDLGVPMSLVVGGSSNNIVLNNVVGDEYTFELDARNPQAPLLTITNGDTFAGTEIYVRGAMNGWSTDNPLHYQGHGKYQTVISITDQGEYAFKIASEDWSTVDRGVLATSSVVMLNNPHNFYVGGGESGMVDAVITLAPGDYLFEVDGTDPLNPTVTITAE